MNGWKQVRVPGRAPGLVAPKPGPPPARPITPLPPRSFPDLPPWPSSPVKDRPVLLICATCRGTGTVLALTSGGSLTCHYSTTSAPHGPWGSTPSYATVRCSACAGFGWVLPTWLAPGYPAAPWWPTNYPAAPWVISNGAGARA